MKYSLPLYIHIWYLRLMKNQDGSIEKAESLFQNYRRIKRDLITLAPTSPRLINKISTDRKILVNTYKRVLNFIEDDFSVSEKRRDIHYLKLTRVELQEPQIKIRHLNNIYVYPESNSTDFNNMGLLEDSYETTSRFFNRPPIKIAGFILREIIALDERGRETILSEIFIRENHQLINWLVFELSELFVLGKKH